VTDNLYLGLGLLTYPPLVNKKYIVAKIGRIIFEGTESKTV